MWNTLTHLRHLHTPPHTCIPTLRSYTRKHVQTHHSCAHVPTCLFQALKTPARRCVGGGASRPPCGGHGGKYDLSHLCKKRRRQDEGKGYFQAVTASMCLGVHDNDTQPPSIGLASFLRHSWSMWEPFYSSVRGPYPGQYCMCTAQRVRTGERNGPGVGLCSMQVQRVMLSRPSGDTRQFLKV